MLHRLRFHTQKPPPIGDGFCVFIFHEGSCGDRTRTYTVQLMGLTSCLCSTPRYVRQRVAELERCPTFLCSALFSQFILYHTYSGHSGQLLIFSRIFLHVPVTRPLYTIFGILTALRHCYCRPSFALYIMQSEHCSVILLAFAQIRLYGVQTPQ